MNAKTLILITTVLGSSCAWSLQAMSDTELSETTARQGLTLVMPPSITYSPSSLAQTWSNLQNQINQLLGQIPIQMNVVLGPIQDASIPNFLSDGSLVDTLNMTMSSMQFQNIKLGSVNASVLTDNTIPSIGSIALTNIHVQGILHMTYLP